MAREELKWQNIDADDLPAAVKKSFDAMVEAEAACADPGADIGAAGDHGLLDFASALGIENLQHEPALLEEAGILP